MHTQAAAREQANQQWEDFTQRTDEFPSFYQDFADLANRDRLEKEKDLQLIYDFWTPAFQFENKGFTLQYLQDITRSIAPLLGSA